MVKRSLTKWIYAFDDSYKGGEPRARLCDARAWGGQTTTQTQTFNKLNKRDTTNVKKCIIWTRRKNLGEWIQRNFFFNSYILIFFYIFEILHLKILILSFLFLLFLAAVRCGRSFFFMCSSEHFFFLHCFLMLLLYGNFLIWIKVNQWRKENEL